MTGALLLLSCTSLNDRFLKELPPQSIEQTETFTGPPQLSCDQSALNFSTLSAASGESQAMTVACTNLGAQELVVNNLVTSTAAFAPTISTTTLAAGGTATITVTFTPSGDSAFTDTLKLFSNAPATPEHTIPLSGVGTAPVAALSPESLSFGAVAIGCQAVQTLSIQSTGSEDLTVTDLDLPEPFEFDQAISLPWTIASGQHRDVALRYAPEAIGSASGVLTVTSDDMSTTRLAALTGSGVSAGTRIDTTVQSADATLDTLFAVSTIASMDDHIDRFLDAFPAYIETLDEIGADYRVAIVIEDGGQVTSQTAYIDAVGSAGLIAEGMLSGQTGQDATESLQMLLDATDSADWLRAGRLNLVGVSDQGDTSTERYESYISAYEDAREDAVDAVVHGIGGDAPAGCGGSWDVDYYAGVYEAAAATGGGFYSMCTGDWEDLMVDLALDGLPTATLFHLSAAPIVETISVLVDGEDAAGSYSYSAADQAVVFGVAPAPGAEVSITYDVQDDCP